MPLQPGTTLGPYSVTAKIGEGGMGEVYQARDTKLDRDVALKVLPEAFTADPDRLSRATTAFSSVGSSAASFLAALAVLLSMPSSSRLGVSETGGSTLVLNQARFE